MKHALIAAAVLGLAGSSFAATVNINDNFDGYANQAAFDAVWAPIGTSTPAGATLSTAQAVSSPNSAFVAGSAGVTQRNRLSFTAIGNLAVGETLTWSFDFYDSNATAGPNRNFSNLQVGTAPSATNQLISMGLNNNHTASDSGGNYYMARILGFTPTTVDPDGGSNEGGTLGSGAYFKLNDYGVGLRSTGWHNLKTVITTADGTSQSYAFYVDNVLAETVSTVGTALRSYDNIALGSGLSNGTQDVYFDNMILQSAVASPEPGSLVLLGVGAAGLLRRRRT